MGGRSVNPFVTSVSAEIDSLYYSTKVSPALTMHDDVVERKKEQG